MKALGQVRLLFGISVFWLALSVPFDGLNTLVLPRYLLSMTDDATRATMFGLLTFVGLLLGLLVQPVAGVWSDRPASCWWMAGQTLVESATVMM